MTKAIFYEPGRKKTVPEISDLKDVILNKGTDYWHKGSGTVSFEFSLEEETIMLMLIFEENNGFYMEYYDAESGGGNPFLPVEDINKEEVVTVYVSGEKHLLPSKAFISRETTLKVIEQFIKTGERYEGCQWLRKGQFEWPIDPEFEDD